MSKPCCKKRRGTRAYPCQTCQQELPSDRVEDQNTNAVPDVMEASKFALDREMAIKDHQARIVEQQNTNRQAEAKLQIEREKVKATRDNMVNDLKIAQIQAKAKAKAVKPKPKKKK